MTPNFALSPPMTIPGKNGDRALRGLLCPKTFEPMYPERWTPQVQKICHLIDEEGRFVMVWSGRHDRLEGKVSPQPCRQGDLEIMRAAICAMLDETAPASDTICGDIHAEHRTLLGDDLAPIASLPVLSGRRLQEMLHEASAHARAQMIRAGWRFLQAPPAHQVPPARPSEMIP